MDRTPRPFGGRIAGAVWLRAQSSGGARICVARFHSIGGQTETLVIGASAAGLATAAALRGRRRAFEIVESEDVVRHRGVGITTARRRDRAPPGTGGRDVGGNNRNGVWRADNVVVATGRARARCPPTWPRMDQYRGDLLHSSEFRNGDRWKGQPVLVVGFGNSACEQALDLVERGDNAHLAVRSGINVLPRDFFGVLPVLSFGIVMRRLPTRVADVLAWPLVRITVGDVTKAGLRKLPYGPNTQIARDHRVPLLDIGTMKQIKQGRITFTATLLGSPRTESSSRMGYRVRWTP
jgi:hypothetical protein